MELKTFTSRQEAATVLANDCAFWLSNAVQSKGQARIAVPGGTTPGPMFRQLRRVPLDWEKVTVMLSDERYIPDHLERSNTRLIKEVLLQDRASLADFQPFYLDGFDVEEAVQRLGPDFEALLPLDVCVLGMGADMHTASLFPGTDELPFALEEDAPAIMAIWPEQPEPRITLTARALAASDRIAVLIFGQEKRDALETAQAADSPLHAPIKTVLGSDLNTIIYYAD